MYCGGGYEHGELSQSSFLSVIDCCHTHDARPVCILLSKRVGWKTHPTNLSLQSMWGTLCDSVPLGRQAREGHHVQEHGCTAVAWRLHSRRSLPSACLLLQRENETQPLCQGLGLIDAWEEAGRPKYHAYTWDSRRCFVLCVT